MPISVGSSSGLQARSVSSSTKASLGIGERIATQGAIKTASSQGLKAVKSAALSTAVSKAATAQIKTTASSSGLKAVSNISKTTSTVLNRLNSIGTASTNNIQSTVTKATKQITNRTASIPVLESKVQAVSISTVKPDVVATNADSIKKAINDVYGEYKLAETNILTAADRGLSANKNVISKSITNAKNAQDVANIQDIGEKSISAISNLAGNLTSKLNNSTSAAIRVLTDNSARNLQAIVPPSMGNILTPTDSSLQLNRNDLRASIPSSMQNIISSTKSPVNISKNNLRATVSKQFTIKPGTSIKMNTPISSIPIVNSTGDTMSISDLDFMARSMVYKKVTNTISGYPISNQDDIHVLTNVPMKFDKDNWNFIKISNNVNDGKLIQRTGNIDDLKQKLGKFSPSYSRSIAGDLDINTGENIGATITKSGYNGENIYVEGDELGISTLRLVMEYLSSEKNHVVRKEYDPDSFTCLNYAKSTADLLTRVGVPEVYVAVISGNGTTDHAVVALKTGEKQYPNGEINPIFALIEPQATDRTFNPSIIGYVGGSEPGQTINAPHIGKITDVAIFENITTMGTAAEETGSYLRTTAENNTILLYSDTGNAFDNSIFGSKLPEKNTDFGGSAKIQQSTKIKQSYLNELKDRYGLKTQEQAIRMARPTNDYIIIDDT